jgi:hypothetical protein
MSDKENGNGAEQALEQASVALPEVWDRTQGDAVTTFAAELDQRWRIAKMIASSGMVSPSQRKPEAVMAIMLSAYELGIPLMQALRGMYFVSGKIGFEGHLMDALAVSRCGVTKTIIKREWNECSIVLHREKWDDIPVSYTLDDAKRAKLISDYDAKAKTVKSAKQGWVQNPREMLYWRALSTGLKIIAPDYFGGVYSLDELEQISSDHSQASAPATGAELDALEAEVVDTDTLDMFEE